MITLVAGLIAAIIFFLEFLGIKLPSHDLLYLGLAFLAIAVAFMGYWPWRGSRTVVHE